MAWDNPDRQPEERSADDIIRALLEGTSAETGADFFRALVKSLAQALGTSSAWVTEYQPEENRLNALAFWHRGGYLKQYNYAVSGTPCELAIQKRGLVHFPENLIHLFPDDKDLPGMHAVSYMGAPLLDASDGVFGHVAVLDDKPMPYDSRMEWLFRIFASRAAAELRRLRAEEAVRESEQQLVRLIGSAMDAILRLDASLSICAVNPAAEKVFGYSMPRLIGRSLCDLLTESSREKVLRIAQSLADPRNGQTSIWISDGLDGKTAGGEIFPFEASLSCYSHLGKPQFTLILRNQYDLAEANRRINLLLGQAEYLQQEIAELRHGHQLLGQSSAMAKIRKAIDQVAPTNATVLLLGETGTGKELIARAIHEASTRSVKLMVKVNCAAMPAGLIESELFGHEKGAFTGATQQRKGRFTLADGGTIFLDEIGELPLDLQAKLLRVLQEGEFEPVGSAKTVRIDVRVIGATNRNLEAEVAAGKFRQDLFYRLNVFPVAIPPLRERGDDVIQMAEVFVSEVSHRLGKSIRPLSAADRRYLLGYDWPGNVRELQNVLERAVILSRDGHLNLADLLQSPRGKDVAHTPAIDLPGQKVLTANDLRSLERSNILAALEQTNWRVSGENGAAQLLGMPASTLASRIKALGITRT